MLLYFLPFFLPPLSLYPAGLVCYVGLQLSQESLSKKVFLKDPIKYLGHISLLLCYFYSLLLRYFYIIGSSIVCSTIILTLSTCVNMCVCVFFLSSSLFRLYIIQILLRFNTRKVEDEGVY